MDLKIETGLSSRPQLEPNDTTALTNDQQKSLNEQKVKVRISNEEYLRQHPEVPFMLESFIQKVLLNKPNDIKVYASSYFTDPKLKENISIQLLQEKERKY